MKRLAGILLGSIILLTAAPAWAQSAYISGNIGFGIRPDGDISSSSSPFENDPAFVINGAIGVEVQPSIRVEGEIGYHWNTADQGGSNVDWRFGVVSFMGNGYFDIPLQSPLKPYVGLGVGFATVVLEAESGGSTASEDDLVAAYQFMLGAGYEISPKAVLNFGYRYFATSDPTYIGFSTEYSSHDFLFGARFRF